MRYYESSVLVDAPAEAIWAVLVDGPSYPDWDSGVTRVDGPSVDGGKITVHAAVSPGRAFPVAVSLTEPTLMRWTGGMPLGLFRGDRRFTLTPSAGGIQVTVREEYTGPLLGLIWRTMPALHQSFSQFTAGLKARVEAHHSDGVISRYGAHRDEDRSHRRRPGYGRDPAGGLRATRPARLAPAEPAPRDPGGG